MDIVKEYPSVLTIPKFRPHSTWESHYPFAFFLVDVLRPKKIVELGVYFGGSFLAWCQIVKKLNLNTKCIGIDAWEGDKNMGDLEEGVYESLVKSRDSDFPEQILLKKYFDEALDDIEDNSIDILHIDGLHTYDAVKNDFIKWLPKMSNSGVVLFHDTQVEKEDFGVKKFWSEISQQHFSFEFHHGFGLGILLVGRDMNEKLIEMFTDKDPDKYRDIFYMLGTSYD
tara:strand:+ start:698 stop:1375 length:678 start_codon:yes stop_codon:yes gene_type:complete